jgi:cell division protein DivIC
MNAIRQYFEAQWERALPYLRNKYLLTIVLLVLWLTFFDRNNFIERIGMVQEVHRLEKDCRFYREKIINDSTRLVELNSSPEMLEKYAREQYLMKKDNEEIFVIVNR